MTSKYAIDYVSTTPFVSGPVTLPSKTDSLAHTPLTVNGPLCSPGYQHVMGIKNIGASDNSSVQQSAGQNSSERKISVSDLIARLTTPTEASRQRMRDDTRSVSSPQPIRSPRRPTNPTDIQISKPMRIYNSPTPSIRQVQQTNASSMAHRKAPSPPRDVPKPTRKPSASTLANGHASQAVSGSQKPAPTRKKDAQLPVIPGTRSTSGSQTASRSRSREENGPTRRPSLAPLTTKFATENTSQGKDFPKSAPPQSQSQSRLGSQLGSFDPKAISRESINSEATSSESSSSTSRSIDQLVNTKIRRKQSAPAPLTNVTDPRAMARASSHGLSFPSPALSISSMPTAPSSPNLNWELPTQPIPEATKTTGANGQNKEIEELREELRRSQEQSESLRIRNKQLKSKLDEAIAAQDQINIELSISQASRNALKQQVSGYEVLQQKNAAQLKRSQKLIKLLQFNLQELKMTLEEREMEIYALNQKRIQSNRDVKAEEDPNPHEKHQDQAQK